ncbi:hypothetical protein HGO21_18935 [Acinetobacter sp. CUI P1]|nr:hypothetical protein [Acinetobacter sp. CUI P1]
MKMKQSLYVLVLIGIVLTNSNLTLASNTGIREKQLEEALLQQLHSSIVSALKSIYKTEYVMFGCKQISSINTLVTLKNQDKESIRTDAMHGGTYFELTISLCNVGSKEDYVELYFKNDTPGANYYLVDYKITPKD